ncbi:MAG: cytochrome c [Oleispira sp.]|nr:cytochrome c [Oleispira sp.]
MNISIDKRIMNNSKKIMLAVIFGILSQWVSALDYPAAGDFSEGSKAWSENCARCHNMRSPTDLRDDQWVTAVFHMRVRAGLTGQETRDIITFLQGSNAKMEKATSVISKPLMGSTTANQSGKSIYENNCVACHGVEGKGALPGVPDFTAKNGRLSKSDGELLSNIITGFQSPGNSMSMPPRGGNSQLSVDDLNAALKHIKKLPK